MKRYSWEPEARVFSYEFRRIENEKSSVLTSSLRGSGGELEYEVNKEIHLGCRYRKSEPAKKGVTIH